jgi:hypothetical protein
MADWDRDILNFKPDPQVCWVCGHVISNVHHRATCYVWYVRPLYHLICIPSEIVFCEAGLKVYVELASMCGHKRSGAEVVYLVSDPFLFSTKDDLERYLAPDRNKHILDLNIWYPLHSQLQLCFQDTLESVQPVSVVKQMVGMLTGFFSVRKTCTSSV